MTSRSRRTRVATAGLALLAVALVPTLQQLPAVAAGPTTTADAVLPADFSPDSVTTLGDTVPGLTEITAPLDATGKTMVALPSAAQKAAAARLGSDVDVTWNDSGTPASIFARDGVLAPSTGQGAVATARSWISTNRALLGISAAQADGLALVSDQPFADSRARAVLFSQTYGDLAAATRSMVTVGIADNGDVTYVSSSLARTTGSLPTDRSAWLSPRAGWLNAAAAVGRTVGGVDRAKITASATKDWTRLNVPGFDQAQLARLRAFAKPDGTVRPVIEANVVDVSGGSSFAYRVMIDAVSGEVLFRQNGVENSSDAFPFQGAYTPLACGPVHPFELTDATTRSIAVLAASAIGADDITIKIFGPGGILLGNFDTATSPEAATYSPGTVLAQGTYGMSVCPFNNAQIGGPYAASVVTSDTGTGSGGATLPAPKWRAFAANPPLGSLSAKVGFTPDNSVVECWFAGTAGCSPGEAHENTSSSGPWDQLNEAPTFTTIGNNANTHEAWASFLTPGGLAAAPVSPTRDYTTPFTDVWNNSGCAPTNFTPGGNDIDAVTGNLFVGHNRIHDFAYALGFTEKNYNLQTSNAGRGGTGGDPEIGNVQAGAVTGGAAGQYMGRDNANQIALQDGVPGITNQYLFQPIAAAFYSPCADGALDTGIYGHEYTHAISNRMVGGPNDGLTSEQGGAMGESWSDLNAAEYQFENDYSLGTLADGTSANPWSLGSYTTGNFAKGIRDYAINDNPLNFSDYGFDTTGAEVHADGEIWNGTLWEVRQALVDTWDAAGFRYTDKALQDRCATPTSDPTTSQPSASSCPGNRRWLQLIFDSWLLQPGATDMLQARNAMMAADQMRFGGANQAVLASAFARRGMGTDATTSTPADGGEDVTTPSFRSAAGNNSAVTFTTAGSGNVYVGDYEARATPVADTDSATAQSATATFTPGIYRMTYVSPANGFRRFVLTVPDDGVAITQAIDDTAVNLAASAAGASVIGSTAGSLNAASLIDGTEATNWGVTSPLNVDDPAQTAATRASVSVDLVGGVQTITSAKVSAMLRPAPVDPNALPVLVGGARVDDDPLSGSRFTALRQFELQACVAACDQDASYSTIFTSSADAFPGDVPRPVVPDQTMRSFSFAPVQAAAVRLVALENQCTGQEKYAGEQDADPTNNTDCKTASERGKTVHASELQVFGDAVPADPTPGVPGTGVPGSGTAGSGTGALPVTDQPITPGAGVPVAAVPVAGASGTSKLLRTRTLVRLPRVQQVRGRESTTMRFSVVSSATSGGVKAGKVVVRLDGKRVKKASVPVVLKSGRKVRGRSYRVPKNLGFGTHTLRVVFTSGNAAAFTSSKSPTIVLTVVRSRPNAT